MLEALIVSLNTNLLPTEKKDILLQFVVVEFLLFAKPRAVQISSASGVSQPLRLVCGEPKLMMGKPSGWRMAAQSE